MRKEYDFSAGRRGAVIAPRRGKTRITIRLDDDLLDWFRARVDAAGGGSYQTLINDALRTFITAQEQPLEQLLRKVLREELREELHRVRRGVQGVRQGVRQGSRSGTRKAA